MKKSFLLIVLTLFFSMHITGCSLFSSGDDKAETATVSESGELAAEGGEFASDEFETGDAAAGDSFESADFDATAMAKDEGGGEIDDLVGEDVEVEDSFSDQYPDDEFGDTALGTDVATGASDDFSEDYIDDNSFSTDVGGTEVGGAAVAENDSLFVDEGGGIPAEPMTTNQEEDLFGQDSMEPVVDTPTFADSSYDSGAVYDVPTGDSSVGDTSNLVPVKKMKPAAYKRAGANINRLYVVRSGDNMDSIAEKIYGSAGAAEKLYKYNPYHRGRTLDVGDKVYYESAINPNDQSMMTYYEDNNISPTYYTSQEGDNIRRVAKNLLGHNRSWMEIYATNSNIESKGRLPAGLQIRYWPEGVSAAPMVAQNTPPPANEAIVEEVVETEVVEPEPIAMEEPTAEIPDMEQPAAAMQEPAEIANINEPDSLGDQNMDDQNPPPAMGQVGGTPPPTQPVAPPPPPPAPTNNMAKPAPPKVIGGDDMNSDPLAAMGDDNMIMGALGGLLILAAIIMLIFIRRSRAKRVNFSQTQV